MQERKKPNQREVDKAGFKQTGTANIQNTYRKTEHAVDAYLMDWTSQNLPNSRSFFITDLDLIIRDIRGNVENWMFVEVKRYRANSPVHQSSTFDVLHKVFRIGLFVLDNEVKCKYGFTHRIEYHKFHMLQFEKTSFEDGLVFWDGKPISEQELIKILSFEKGANR